MRKTFPNRRLALGIISLALCMSSIFWVAISASSSADTRAVNSLGGVDSVNVLSQRANDIIYNALDSKLYISVPSIVGPTGNSIRRIDPMQLSVGTPLWVGSEPNKLSLSADGHSLYVGLDGRIFNSQVRYVEQYSRSTVRVRLRVLRRGTLSSIRNLGHRRFSH
jgi:DNA-binding beta-propeller fold protein YncE